MTKDDVIEQIEWSGLVCCSLFLLSVISSRHSVHFAICTINVVVSMYVYFFSCPVQWKCTKHSITKVGLVAYVMPQNKTSTRKENALEMFINWNSKICLRNHVHDYCVLDQVIRKQNCYLSSWNTQKLSQLTVLFHRSVIIILLKLLIVITIAKNHIMINDA